MRKSHTFPEQGLGQGNNTSKSCISAVICLADVRDAQNEANKERISSQKLSFSLLEYSNSSVLKGVGSRERVRRGDRARDHENKSQKKKQYAKEQKN
jgi:hypothetical protein